MDYAWKYFESASSRRASFLNFFLVLTGILANALVLSIANGLWLGGMLVGMYGAMASAAFIAFDCRYLTFVNRSLRVLAHLERQHFFPDGLVDSDGQIGLARIEPDGRKDAVRRIQKVKFWQRWVVYGIALACFTFGAIYAIADRDRIAGAHAVATRVEHLEKAIHGLEDLDSRVPVENVLPPSNHINGNANP